MKQWYIFYTSIDSQLLQRIVAELQSSVNEKYLKLQRPVGELDEIVKNTPHLQELHSP